MHRFDPVGAVPSDLRNGTRRPRNRPRRTVRGPIWALLASLTSAALEAPAADDLSERPDAITNSLQDRGVLGLDVAPFGRIVTWDPDRLEGTRASRIEEFPAEDLFLETDLPPDAAGRYHTPVTTNGLACLGVQWLNRRALNELTLEFVDPGQVPPTNQVRVEGWFGESAWQGKWLPLAGALEAQRSRLVFRVAPPSPGGDVVLTRKARWIWPAASKLVPVQRPSVTTRSVWDSADLLVQFDRPTPAPAGFEETRREHDGPLLSILNGEFIGLPHIRWDATEPQTFQVRYSRPSSFHSDPTLVLLSLPWDRVGIAVQDILDHEGVYLPAFGAFFCRADRPVSLAEYRAGITGRRTILEEVRELPDQTLEQAMARTHRPAQREGPVMLSLAGDNAKYVVERDGTVRFRLTPHTGTDWHVETVELGLGFADGPPEKRTRELEGGWLPLVGITHQRGELVVKQRAFVAPSDDASHGVPKWQRPALCVVEFRVVGGPTNRAGFPLRLTFQRRPTSAPPVRIVEDSSGFLVAADRDELLALVPKGAGGAGLPVVADNALVFGPECFAAGRDAWCVYLLPPGTAGAPPQDVLDPARLRAGLEAYWNAVLASATQIQTPAPFLNDLIRSSQVRCLIAARNEADGERIAPWIAAMSYGPLESEAHSVIRGMDFLGHHAFARRGLEYFMHRYNTNGFLTTGYTTFGTAWHLWTLGEHVALTRDTNWLKPKVPELKRLGRWIAAQTAKTRQAPEADPRAADRADPRPPARTPATAVAGTAHVAGLMPPGVMADWNAYAYHFCLNAYYVAALRELGAALERVGDPDAATFRSESQALARATAASYQWTRQQSPAVALRDGTWVPYYPSQAHSPGKLNDFFPAEDAGRSWCYDVEVGAHQLVPTGVLDAFDDRVEPMLNHLEDVQFLADGWFDYAAPDNARDWYNLGGFSKVQPYYARNAEIYAERDDVKPFLRSYFNTLAAMVNPEVLTFWEHFNHSGAWDKTHETGYFLHQTRLMLVQERGNELWLAPLVTTNWLHDGMTLAVTNAPTRFGNVSYRLDSHVAQGRIEATIESPASAPLGRIVLRLRHPEGRPLEAVEVNGARHDDFDPTHGLIRLSPKPARLQLVAEYKRAAAP